MIDIKSWDVYLVTDTFLSRGRSDLEIIEAAISGGISAVQLREKHLASKDFYLKGIEIRELLIEHNVPLIVNDRIDLALALNAEGIHLGQSDLPLKVARQILGPDKIIGWSVNELSQINDETASLVDYFAISPVFFTSTKKDIAAPWGLEGVAKARSNTNKPLVGIGGLGLKTLWNPPLSLPTPWVTLLLLLEL
ncbi:MAG: thiamine phosphate synthase [Deltaproteobacteria bacterium]|nr:thiamine phosphate synthase [Deltaproteobacteria bacterium]